MQSGHTRRSSLLYAGGLLAGGLLPTSVRAAEITRWPPPRKALVLRAKDLSGRDWTLQDIRNKVVLLNFWATWCEPCRSEMPALARLGQSDDQLAVLAVNFKENPSRAERFMREVAPNVPVLLDTDGDVAKTWGVKIFPTTVLIGRDGLPHWRVRGEFDWDSTEAKKLLQGLLAR
jgi:thiol-disulfide isomerase/thioredoxin